MVELSKAGDLYQHGFPNWVLFFAFGVGVPIAGKYSHLHYTAV